MSKKLPLPNIKSAKTPKNQIKYDLILKALGWSMKIIGKTGSGKTSFLPAFKGFYRLIVKKNYV